MDTNIKGIVTELKCKTYFLELGYTVSTPENPVRYDFILDTGDKLLKVQVKTSSARDESSIKFSCRSTHVNCRGVSNVRYKAEDVDYFATYWEGQCYLVPFNECSTEKTLRFSPPKSGQIKGITFAKDYLLHTQIEKIREKS